MRKIVKLLLISALLLSRTSPLNASNVIPINWTNQSVLLDGQCEDDEWRDATKIRLPAQASIYLLHDRDSFYICAKGIKGDTTVLDLYIENTQTGHLHKFHLSAQMGEQIKTEKGWQKTGSWKLNNWTGFWVPYFGYEETEEGKRPKFFRGLHRQVQILRKKFPGDQWNIMFGVHIKRNGEWTEYSYPEKASAEEKSTWGSFSFSKKDG
ncbi:hypothetical protein FLL45_22010 [Aliikangiella marina]|uniref:Carbohydrate-binding domain-containing protein n=1 Tax=Aliikangiella marina TaxID=1712262 RepID=A0A545T1F2_9GAMM|nr:hypothetical protein [Aliikangiella marina]TQV71005.1 hypothetical protein FLL45_22010 [Aliikangiella marina]